LFGFKIVLKNKPPFFLEKLREEFYRWIDATGINANNCPEDLARILLNIHEVSEGNGDRFAKERLKEVREHVQNMSKEEYEIKLNDAIAAFNDPLENERNKAITLEGQTYKDTNIANMFCGASEKGKEAFQQIMQSITQQDNHQEVVMDIK
jgi:hypothetical protein